MTLLFEQMSKYMVTLLVLAVICCVGTIFLVAGLISANRRKKQMTVRMLQSL